jgi:putative iron-dependent peroxidase
MSIESQNVTDYPNSNTIFMVWKLNDSPQLKDVFQKLCALILNLNNSVFNRFPDSRASCVIGIGCEA